VAGSKGEGDRDPWTVCVNQFTGVGTKPAVR
jgi:hypothetical protein